MDKHNQQPHYLQEFPDYDDKLHMIDGFFDASYHNETSPCIAKYYKIGENDETTKSVEIYQDYKNPELSELSGYPDGEYKRFNVYKNTYSAENGSDITPILSTNSWEKAKKCALQLVKEIEHELPTKASAER